MKYVEAHGLEQIKLVTNKRLFLAVNVFNGLQYLQTDGCIQYEAKLTGCLSTSILSEGEGAFPTNGTFMSPGLNAQIHQHFFCVRIDPAIDCEEGGRGLVVSEVLLLHTSLPNYMLDPPMEANRQALGMKQSAYDCFAFMEHTRVHLSY